MLTPTDVAVSSRGEIHVAEPAINRIQIFSPSGKFRLAMGTGGTRAGQFNNPIGIALDCNDDIYVVDTLNGRVQKFRRDGVWVYDWGTTTVKIERLNHPLRACITSQGNIYIADTPGNVLDVHRIVEFRLPPCITPVRQTTWSDMRRIFRSKQR
ncbi:MAG: hypothetical protein GWN29_09805 [Gammaproteobacteria bacterium]|nr:hypothetical protein [Gammaproteobacteria bacterium]